MTHTIYNAATGQTTTVAVTDSEKAVFAANKVEADKIAYKFKRREEYPAITDQLDLLYKDLLAGKLDATGEWAKAIKTVKDNNPKP